MAILNLPPGQWEIIKTTTIENNEGLLGDGYTLTGAIPFSQRDSITLVFAGLGDAAFTSLWATIKNFEGAGAFEWREFEWMPFKTYVFDGEPRTTNRGAGCWDVSVTLKEIK